MKKAYQSNIPYINYVFEDKSKYPTAASKGYYDPDNDFLIGNSTGFLMNINFEVRNTHLLREVGIYYDKYKRYTNFETDSYQHKQFRKREESRRKNGMTANCKLLHKDIDKYDELISKGKVKEAESLLLPLTITGQHYNFINYGNINKLQLNTVTVSKVPRADGSFDVKVSGKKDYGIAEFFMSQYWWYKSKKFAINNAYHIIGGKSRRAGFSYMSGVDSANDVNLYPNMTVIHAAFDTKYLTKGNAITRMAMNQTDFYEKNTPFVRGIISRDLEDIYIGYKEKDGTDAGYKGHILSVSAGPANPDCAIGKDGLEIKCEELSNFPNFDDFMNVTEPTTRAGSITTGLISAWGTGGSTEGKWIVFEKNFYNPDDFKFMPFENVWDPNSRHKICGFFKPYVESLQGFNENGESSMDIHGNTNYSIAEKISDNERLSYKLKNKDEQKYIVYCGQYANSPSEAFSSTSENMFTSLEFNRHVDLIKHNPDYKIHTDGILIENEETLSGIEFIPNSKLKDPKLIHNFIEAVPVRSFDDLHGCTRIFHQPLKDRTGKVLENTYTVTYDPYGKSKDNFNNKDSLASITAWMEPNEINPFAKRRRVASFVGRRVSMEEVDRIAYMMCKYYNAKLFFENNRGETKSNFKVWNALNILLKEPIIVWDSNIKSKVAGEFGMTVGNDIRKLQGLRLLKGYLYEKIGTKEDGEYIYWFNTITDLPYLLELQMWDNEGNYDRVSDAILWAFDLKRKELLATLELQTKKRIQSSNNSSVFSRVWYA